MRKGEKAWGEIDPSWFWENDWKAISQYNLDETKHFYFDIELLDFEPVVDFYNDLTTTLKTIRSGYSRTPFIESTVTFRMYLEVNGEVKFDNMLTEEELKLHTDWIW